ncbi:MAG: DUF4143 domain-containing protein [Chitinivibrionales bacterium]|nr:DUF4143 domain-containing protein [Chitinivibrionales bacterium]
MSALRRSPVTAILGPRQCGKTTLVRMLPTDGLRHVFDLEDPRDRARLAAPMLALEGLSGVVVLDEIQRMPELFEALRVLADRPSNPARFLILGSASPGLVKGASESLAGRIAFVDMEGFSLDETGREEYRRLWIRGGFPPSFLASDDKDSIAWRQDFIRTFVERDVPQLGFSIPSETVRRFWTMVAHFHGQVLNVAELARSLGNSEASARRYLDLLTGAFVVRQLLPWHENLKKRQVKSPKVYVRDSGLLHAMLGVSGVETLWAHGKVGASWEGFVLSELVAMVGARNLYFWATHSGAELDVLLMHEQKRFGFECKLTDTPRTTRSMHVALSDLGLQHLFVVHPGTQSYPLASAISALSITDLHRWPSLGAHPDQ